MPFVRLRVMLPFSTTDDEVRDMVRYAGVNSWSDLQAEEQDSIRVVTHMVRTRSHDPDDLSLRRVIERWASFGGTAVVVRSSR